LELLEVNVMMTSQAAGALKMKILLSITGVLFLLITSPLALAGGIQVVAQIPEQDHKKIGEAVEIPINIYSEEFARVFSSISVPSNCRRGRVSWVCPMTLMPVPLECTILFLMRFPSTMCEWCEHS
jgi:hypothetical protein